MRSKFSLIVCFIILIGAVAILLVLPIVNRPAKLNDKLLEAIPRVVPGWEVRDIPIAESEEMKKAVNELLNYETAVFREYKRESRVLQLYAAYWPPKKFHPRLIAIHTPDVCWVGNGWLMSRPDYGYKVPTVGPSLHHAQYRLFEAHGAHLNVIYWHVIDGHLSGYAEGVYSRSNNFFEDLISSLKNGAGEQFFIRLSSPQPWSEWSGDELYESILKVLSPVLQDVPASVDTR